MAFVRIIPRSRSSSGDVKVSFTGSKTVYANIYFSFELLDKIGWERDCRLYVYYDDVDKKKWMIEKSDAKKDSFRLASAKDEKTKTSKLQFRFNAKEIKKDDRKLRAVDFEIEDGRIVIKNK